MIIERRAFVRYVSTLCASHIVGLESTFAASNSNFHAVYDNENLKNDFFGFLDNVFSITDPVKLEALIEASTHKFETDREIYADIQAGLPQVKLSLDAVRYELPALRKQQNEMAKQSLALLPQTAFEGYLEIGAYGIYRSALSRHLSLAGDSYFVVDKKEGNSLKSMVMTKHLFPQGRELLLNNYVPQISEIADESIELVTNFIGLHHCPLDRLDAYLQSLRAKMKKGAIMLLRDHDCMNSSVMSQVALAHDVFNAGTEMSVAYNETELRLFKPLAQTIEMMRRNGFERLPGEIYQQGDPTLNALMIFKKT
jgi:hypothetical protein